MLHLSPKSTLFPYTTLFRSINGGFFIFKKAIFNYIHEKEELVIEPFQRLVAEKQLIGYPYDGFWASMDTFKDKQQLESLCAKGDRKSTRLNSSHVEISYAVF